MLCFKTSLTGNVLPTMQVFLSTGDFSSINTGIEMASPHD